MLAKIIQIPRFQRVAAIITQMLLTKPVRSARQRIAQLVRQHPAATPWALLGLVSAELRKAAPELADSLTPALLKGWIGSARKLVRDAGVVGGISEPPSSFGEYLAGEHAPELVKWPALSAAVRDLINRQVLTWPQYKLLTAEAKNTAFSVAMVLTEDGVASVRDAVAEAVSDGMSLKQFRRQAPELADAGLREHQVETIFRTQVLQARGAGMRAVLGHPAVASEFPYAAYHAVHDSRTGDKDPRFVFPTHRMMEQLGIQGTSIYRSDDPELLRRWPPWRWHCRCQIVLLSVADAAAAGIREALLWERTGVPPANPAWVAPIPFFPPPGWPTGGSSIRPIVP